MSNINLLPEELRRREQKELEHLAKQKRVERIELNRPLPVQQAIKKESDKPKKSWLKEFFGTRAKKTAVPLQSPQPLAKSSLDLDLLAASRKKQFNYKFGAKPQDFTKAAYAGPQERHPVRPQPLQPQPLQPAAPRPQNGFFPQPQPPRPAMPLAPYKTYAKPKEKKSFWAWLFAKKPKAPKPAPIAKPVAVPAPLPPRPAPAPHPIAVPALAKKEPRDSWWKILHGLFTSSKKKNISGLHLAGEHARVMAAPTPAFRPHNGHKPEMKPAQPMAKPVQPGYHQAPPVQPSAVRINLAKLPPAKPEYREPSFALKMLIFIAAWILPMLAVYGCSALIKQQQSKIDSQIAQEEQKMSQLNAQLSPYWQKRAQLDAFSGRLSSLKLMLDNQNTWGTFFEQLEKYTLDDVYYREMSAQSDGQMSLSALAPSYQKAAEQAAVFSGAGGFVQDMKVNEAKEANDEKTGQVMINFQPRLNLSEGIFNKNWQMK